jgi:acyl transferase domain-containing protein/acyl carrier protein
MPPDASAGLAGEIAVIGMGCRFPGGAEGLDRYWDLLDGGVDAIVGVPEDRWAAGLRYYDGSSLVPGKTKAMSGGFLDDIAGWDAEHFGVPPQEARRIDPQQRLVMEVAWRAIEDAGIGLAEFRAARAGIFAGVTDSQQFTRLEHQYDPPCVDDPYMAVGSSVAMAAGRLAFFLDARGPALSVDTACSTSLVAMHLAMESLLRGECDLAIVAAASAVIHPESFVAAYQIGMLARDGHCRAFDRHADGFSIGEGAGAVLLERAGDATRNRRRIRAVARGSAVNQNGRNDGITAPQRKAQADVIRQALARGAVGAAEVVFVEAHGAGTVLGDAIELEALAEVFGPRDQDRVLHIGAVKTNMGHLLVAAGMAGLIKTVLALERRKIPSNINFQVPNPILRRTPWLQPVTRAVELDPGQRPIVGVSSFGWSGTNAHVVLQAAPAPAGSVDQIVSLPAHPFERRKFWPSAPVRAGATADGFAASADAGADGLTLHCYTRVWRQPVTPARGSGHSGTAVLFPSAAGLEDALAERLRAAGWQVHLAPAGLPARDRAALLERAAAASDAAGVQVVDFSGLGAAGAPGAGDPVTAFCGLMLTCQAISRSLAGRGVTLVAAVSGTVEVVGGDAGSVAGGACAGLMSALSAEYPWLRWRVVDLDPAAVAAGAAAADSLAGQVLAEIGSIAADEAGKAPGQGLVSAAPSEGSLIAWRNARRWEAQWAPVEIPATPSPWRADGVYVITGGTRGLGMALAKHIARAGRPKLVLVGRTELPPRSRWDAVLDGTAPATDRVRGTIADVMEIHRGGAQTLLLTADARDQAQMRSVLRAAQDRYGAVHGIAHCAGVPGGGLLDRKTAADAAAVISAKTGVLAPVTELMHAGQLDFVVLYSSAVTALGGLGETDYAAANACLETFASANSASGTRVLAVSWGPWQHDDWQPDALAGAPALALATRRYRSEFGITADSGTALLDRLIGVTLANVLVLTESLASARQRWAGLRDVDVMAPASAADVRQPRPDLLAPYVPPGTPLQNSIAEIWRQYLGLEQVGIDDPFFDLGGNSLMAVSMVRRLERDLELALPPSLLFERPTVRELAAALGNEQRAGQGQRARQDDGGLRRRLRTEAVQARRRELLIRKEEKT